ncbi:MAG: ATPase [Candidatus Wallbacteria bacterium HGW-Wallbacteria-1]|jgi:MoxR-like ATPase|uniref:ATPase n=1 Tax=Candidatus Wallbacteria bacterium HGW-Wallbacteria-1 TaxID=2013854 RepID=A0A2N1PLH0_9BACT|nr:MAG: ATPase [Candidatus Wallbacteria bacterium HGW-Wallbacteria-1]
MNKDIRELNEKVKQASAFVTQVSEEMSKVVVGQKYMVDRLLIGLLADGHILLEGVPGLAKTLTVNTLSRMIDCEFKRIQFTPDLLPADLIGTQIYNMKSGGFDIRKGPVFANIILADEINRAPAKVQAALLESMQERQVTIGDETFKLPVPFLVMATQNPIEQEGTYPLPEAQVDRFMLKLKITYPTKSEEFEIVRKMSGGSIPEVSKILTPEQIIEARRIVDQIYVDDNVVQYIVDVVNATRNPSDYGLDIAELINFGASPRASINLTRAAKAHAFLRGRGYVTPDDVKMVGMDVLRHRVMVSYEAEAEDVTSEDIVRRIFDNVEIP